MRRIRVDPVATAHPSHRRRIEPRGLDQDVLRLRRDHRLPAAHHAGQTKRLALIGHNHVLGIERPLHAVERLQLLSGTRPPHHDRAFHPIQIEGVGGMPHAQQHVVAGVDSIQDLLLPQRGEPLGDQSLRRPDVHIAQDARSETATRLGRVNPHRMPFAPHRMPRARRRRRQGRIERRKRQSIDRRRLPRHLIVIHRVHAIGRDVHLEQRPTRRKNHIEDTFDSNAAKRQIIGKHAVIRGQIGKVGAKPGGE